MSPDGDASYQWMLSQVPNFAEFNNMFEFYKICGIKTKFIFDKNSIDVGTTGVSQILPELITYTDYNTVTNASTLAASLDRSTLRTQQLTRPISHYFKPKWYNDWYNSDANQTILQNGFNKWLSTNSTGNVSELDIPHVGLKYSVDGSMGGGTGTNTIGHLRIYTTYYLAFKGTN